MKTLFVTYHYLHGHGGSVFASRAYVNAFAALSQRMTLICPVTRENGPEGLADGIKVVPVLRSRNPLVYVRNFVLGVLHRYYDVFPRVLREGGFDTVVFDTCYASIRLLEKARQAGCRIITVHHNYQQEFVRDNFTGFKRWRMTRLTRRWEGAAVQGSDINITLTEPDHQLLQRAYDPEGKCRFAVGGVFESAPGGKDALHSLGKTDSSFHGSSVESAFLITGNLAYPQTELSLLPWLEHYWPMLCKLVPGAHLTVAGANPTAKLQEACARAGVTVVPNPPDMAPLLQEASCYICPTFLGGGIKLRIMDGLRYGLPVLTHSVSARGYEALLGSSVFSYSNEKEFMEALQALIARAARPEAIRGAFLSNFSFEAGRERLRKLLQCILL